MIKGKCTSNRDEFSRSGKWPELFVAVPRVGERVGSDTGIDWQVTSVVHKMTKPFTCGSSSMYDVPVEAEPYVEIHLYPGYSK